MPSLSFRMPLRFLRGSYSRLVLTVIALACGVALVCAIDLVNRAVLRAFVEVVDTMAGRAALQVTAGEDGLFPEEVAATVAAVPGVRLAVPVVNATAFTADESGELLTVHGVDITNEKAVRVYEARDQGGLEIEDPLVFLNQPDSIVLTRSFAARRGLKIGDPIDLMIPTGRHRFTVRGLLEPQGVARVFGGNFAVMDLMAAEAAFTRPGFVNRVDVVIGSRDDVQRVSQSVATVLPGGLRVEAPNQRKADLNKVMQSLQVMLQGLGVVALVAAFLIAFNHLSTVFDRRSWQLGVLRAGGLRTRVIWRELLKESLLVGTTGVVVGIPLGIAVARFILPIIATTTALNYKLVAPETDLSIRAPSLLLATGMGLGAALLAALLPAWRAACVTVTEMIRGRGIEQPGPGATWFWAARGVVLAGVVVMLAFQHATKAAVWGLLATALIAMATALAARPLVHLARAALIARAGTHLGSTVRFLSAVVSHNPRRTALTVAVLGVGLGSVLWLGTIAHSFERSTLDTLRQAMQADLIVSSAHVVSGYLEVPVDETLAADIRAIPGVQATVGVRVRDWEHAGGTVALDAFDPSYFTAPVFGQWPLVGERLPNAWEQVARGEGVVVSSNFVTNVGGKVGDKITLTTPNGPLPVQITGVTVDFASPRGTIEMSRDLYRRFWNDQQLTRVFVRAVPGAALPSLRESIAKTVGRRYGLRVLSSRELMDYFAMQVRRAFAPVNILAAMTLLVVVMGMSDTLVAGVVERTRDLGVMRAVGVRRRYLRRLVVGEGIVLGALGLLLALLAGLTLGTLWVETTFPYLLGWALSLSVPYTWAAVVVAVTLAVCAVASLLPAWRAAALKPAVALRYE